MEQYFVANDVKEEKKTSMFITLSGEAMYDILKSLTHPNKPSEKTYKEILDLLRGHFMPKSNKRVERYKFNKAIQESGEKISEFIVRLKTLAQTCKFGDFLESETGPSVGKFKLKILDEALTDRFIIGLINEKIKSALLNEETLTFDECCAKALQMEMVQKESKSLNQLSIKAIKKSGQNFKSKPKNKNNFSQSQSSQSNNSYRSRENKAGQCRRCGRNHNEQTCPANKWKCYKCERFGHISINVFKVCFK